MVAVDDGDADAGLAEAAHLRGEEEAGAVVAPVAVVDVARDEEECGLLFEAEGDEVLEGAAGGAADLRDGRAVVAIEAREGAVDVEVGGEDQLHGAALCRRSGEAACADVTHGDW